jgi:hypothetical protein
MANVLLDSTVVIDIPKGRPRTVGRFLGFVVEHWPAGE